MENKRALTNFQKQINVELLIMKIIVNILKRKQLSVRSLARGRVTRLLCLLAGYCITSFSVMEAKIYYVDFIDGSNANSGLTPEAPWKNAPGDTAAGGIPSTLKLLPADVVKFKGGTIYRGAIVVETSGAADAPIIFDGNTDESWGKGHSVIDQSNEQLVAFTALAGVSNLVIRGFEIRNVGGYSDDNPILSQNEPLITKPHVGTALAFGRGGNKNIQLLDLFVHRVGQWRNQLPFSGDQSVTGTGISLQDCDGVIVRRCNFTRMRTPISIKSTTKICNIDVIDCNLYQNICWGIDIAPRRAGAVLENITIKNTNIYDYHQFDSGNWLGAGEKPHTDGIFIRTAGMVSAWKNINIDGCFFYTDDKGNSKGGTASIFVSQGPSVNIYNNIFYNDVHSRAVGIGYSNPAGMDEQVVRIYNNTFVDGPTHIILSGEVDPAKRSVYIQNNIFQRTSRVNSVMINHEGGAPPKKLDNNIYWDKENVESERYVLYSGGYKRMSDVRNLGYETKGMYADPLLRNATDTVGKNCDFSLLSGPAVKMGDNLSPFFTKDRLGRARNLNGAWDVGAIMYFPAGAPRLTPPSRFRKVD